MKRKKLEYVSVGEKVQLINTMDGHPQQKNLERPPDTKKNERGESFRKVKKKEKTSRP